MIQALRILRDRNDILALVAILLSIQFFPGKGVPAGIYGLGIVGGSALALQAIGIVLVYRSNRIINFAQVQVGVVAGTLFATLVRYQPLVRLVQSVCPPCLDRPLPESRAGQTAFLVDSVYKVNYYASIILAFGFALLLGFLIYRFVVRRFDNAPRLILTVATIFIAQTLGGLQALIPRLLTTEAQREAGLQLNAPPVPFTFTLRWEPARFNAPEVLTVVVAAIAIGGLFWYFRRSSTGVAIRAGAENPARVATLGVNVTSVTARVWIFAAALSGIVAILQAMSVGGQGSTSLSVSSTVRILAVAVIARMVSLPMTALAAVVFGILDQGVLWAFGSVVVLDGVLLFIVGAVLLLQRFKVSRAELEQASAWRAAREIRPTPKELAGVPSVRRWYRNLRVLGVIVALGVPWALSPSQTNLAALTLIYMMIAASLLVLTGWAGQISLGQFAFAAIGGYVAAVLHAPFPIPLLLGAAVGAVAAVVVGLPALKMRGLHLAITTMALALSATALLLNPRYLGKSLPSTLERPVLLGMKLDDQRVFYYFALVLLAAVTAAVVGMRRSRTARALIAARDNEQAAQSFGINLVRLRLGAFAASGFIAALAGALFAYHQYGVKSQAYAPEQSILMFTMAVIGGLGSLTAVYIGALYVGILTIFGASPIFFALSSGAGGLALLLFIPGGLGQLVFDIRDGVLRRVASRHRIVVPSLVADLRVDVSGAPTAAIAPKMRPGGGAVFVPRRYRLDDQWALEDDGKTPSTTGERVGG